jgi:arylsulfatase
VAPGKHTVSFEFTYDGPGFGKGGTGVLKVPHTTPFIFQWDETFDVGSDTGTPVDDRDYKVPFAFTGTLNKLTVQVEPEQMLPEQKKGLKKKIGEKD